MSYELIAVLATSMLELAVGLAGFIYLGRQGRYMAEHMTVANRYLADQVTVVGQSRPIWFWVGVIVLLIGLDSHPFGLAQDRILAADVQGWELFRSESTLEVLTVDRDGREHWSKFWLVVLDRQLYLRLGTRGAARVEGNIKKPFVSVKVAGQRFDNVRVVQAPEMAEAVAAAIAKKYWSDLVIRWFPHPMTVRLERGQ